MIFNEKMRIASLVLEYLTVLAWPTVVLFLVCMFRNHIRDIVKRLKNADLPGGVKINLQETIKEAEKLSGDVAEIKPPPEKRGVPTIPITEANSKMMAVGLRPSPSGLDLDYYRTLAQQDPNIALAGLRIELEIMTNNLAKGFNVPAEQRMPLRLLVGELYKHNAITVEQKQLIERISTVCNAAAHGEPVTLQETNQIINSAKVLAEQYASWLSWGLD